MVTILGQPVDSAMAVMMRALDPLAAKIRDNFPAVMEDYRRSLNIVTRPPPYQVGTTFTRSTWAIHGNPPLSAHILVRYCVLSRRQVAQAPPINAASGGGTRIADPIIITFSILAGILAAVLAVFFMHKRGNKNFWGKVLPPKVGRETTLLVTGVYVSVHV